MSPCPAPLLTVLTVSALSLSLLAPGRSCCLPRRVSLHLFAALTAAPEPSLSFTQPRSLPGARPPGLFGSSCSSWLGQGTVMLW